MGKLVKNHWARLIVLVASAIQVAASIQGFFWPKLFWDFLTTNLDMAVRPVPILQIINLLLGLLGLSLEWPLPLFIAASNAVSKFNDSNRKTSSKEASSPIKPLSWSTKTLSTVHSSIETRLFVYPLSSLAAFLLYQGTNAGFYYVIGMIIYFWAFSEGEVIMGAPWALPKKPSRSGREASKV